MGKFKKRQWIVFSYLIILIFLTGIVNFGSPGYVMAEETADETASGESAESEPVENKEPIENDAKEKYKIEVQKETLVDLRLDEAAIQRGYTLESEKKDIRLGVPPEIFHAATPLTIKRVAGQPVPINKILLSEIYEYDIKNGQAYDGAKPMYLQLGLKKESNLRKQIYFWNTFEQNWRAIPSKSYNAELFVRANIHLPYAIVAVFAEPDIMEEGKASWYGYKGCLCAASPDFPEKTKVKVTNLENNKTVIVTINDYGPDRSIFPDRVIDLDGVAFKQLAGLNSGVIDVKVESIDYYKEPITVTASPDSLALNSRAALVAKASTGEILWSKNELEKLPIASLTKLMTLHVFLQTETPWEKEVLYMAEDNAEGTRLYVQPGETMTVKDLFNTALLGSANNAIKSLVRSTGKTTEEFVAEMNNEAEKWGLDQTYFVEPTGLSELNVSSAADLLVMARNIFANPVLLEAAKQSSYVFRTINTNKRHTIRNTNQLLGTDLDVLIGKTGFTYESGYCFVAKARNGHNEELIAIVLNSPNSEARFAEAENLLRWAFLQEG